MKLVTILNSQDQLVYNSKNSPKWYVISKIMALFAWKKKCNSLLQRCFGENLLTIFCGRTRAGHGVFLHRPSQQEATTNWSFQKNCIGELFVLGNVICPNSFGNFVRIFKLVVSTHLKNMLVKLDHFPTDWGENRKYLKPPPRKEIQEAFCKHVPLKKIFQQRVYSSEQN